MNDFAFTWLGVATDDGGTYDPDVQGAENGSISDGDTSGDPYVAGEQMTLTPESGMPSSDWEFYGTYSGPETGGVEIVILQNTTTMKFNAVANPPDPATFVVSSFPIASINQGDFTPCFAAGTRIMTPTGEKVVESLVTGDLVTTADGRSVPVKWIGHKTVSTLFAGESARPVRVAAGAFGDGLPHSDLVLTADHALIIDELAINAGALVNGGTITRDPTSSLPERVTYYHVETEGHEVILANGVDVETYVDYIGRRAFDNHEEYLELYGEERSIPEMPLPRVSSARLLPPAIRARLAGRRSA